jgi:hypothetical protein
MSLKYPRRHLATVVGAPKYVASVYDSPDFRDRYTILLTGPGFEFTPYGVPRRAHFLGLSYDCTSPQGVSMYGEVDMRWCLEQRSTRIPWAALPEHVQRHIRARVET